MCAKRRLNASPISANEPADNCACSGVATAIAGYLTLDGFPLIPMEAPSICPTVKPMAMPSLVSLGLAGRIVITRLPSPPMEPSIVKSAGVIAGARECAFLTTKRAIRFFNSSINACSLASGVVLLIHTYRIFFTQRTLNTLANWHLKLINFCKRLKNLR